MKSLLFAGLILISAPSFASLLGLIEGSNSYVEVAILDYQPKATVDLEIQVDGTSENGYRHISAYLAVDAYNALFNSNEELSVETETLNYSAKNEYDQRIVTIERLALDDSGEVASKDVATIVMTVDTATLKVQAYRRKQFLVFVGDLKLVSESKMDGLVVYREGISLYGDNKGWPLGKVITQKGLEKATQDTSTSGLKGACEAECE